ncbi:hypothetical protein J7E96_20765 [Streptomyces sp. ISL-96]|uniref:hypothetical protein n=1 Tax=unclassified Streptomyces TaxID=2593676 RepID=UPI001BEC42D4|nr:MULTISPECIES: hypothetical protein [unclassified Streptomyces]MBT2397835.1 hypothetical protein [Streptomyces sp. ISL-100]MBT2490903.1 hypothetical protein [Streptomyces sp. ISL-96]
MDEQHGRAAVADQVRARCVPWDSECCDGARLFLAGRRDAAHGHGVDARDRQAPQGLPREVSVVARADTKSAWPICIA